MTNGVPVEHSAVSLLSWIKQETDTPMEVDELQELMFDVGGYGALEFCDLAAYGTASARA